MPPSEHGGIISGLGAGEAEIGPAKPLKCGERIRHAVGPGRFERRLELVEAAPGDVGEQFLAVAGNVDRAPRG